jgi:hypothetical protein
MRHCNGKPSANGKRNYRNHDGSTLTTNGNASRLSCPASSPGAASICAVADGAAQTVSAPTPTPTTQGQAAPAETNGAAPLEPSATVVVGAVKPAAEGRGSGGRFTGGNRFGKGNPHARRMAALRQAFLSAATEERMRELGEKLFAAALAGDWQAAKLLLPFVIGRPADAVNPDALDMEEWKGCQEWDSIHSKWFNRISFADALRLHKALSELGQEGIERMSGPPDIVTEDAITIG